MEATVIGVSGRSVKTLAGVPLLTEPELAPTQSPPPTERHALGSIMRQNWNVSRLVQVCDRDH